jgi:HD-GYP domain-containing protein (c-di-GMP phosphodiesterase class II)
MSRISYLFDKLWHKENKVIIHNDITAIDGICLARKNSKIDASFWENFIQLKYADPGSLSKLKETDIYEHLQNLLQSDKYKFIASTNENIVLSILDILSLQTPLIKELTWMSKFPYRYHHSLAVALITIKLLIEHNFAETEVKKAAASALTHDFGITRISRDILQKISALNDDEKIHIREHPLYSYILLSYYLNDINHPSALISYTHHEDMQGSGYPRGIIQEDVVARCIKIADAFDALISDRPFRPALNPQKALENIEGQVEQQKIDPDLFKILKRLVDKS